VLALRQREIDQVARATMRAYSSAMASSAPAISPSKAASCRASAHRSTPEAVAPHREHARRLCAEHRLDRPRRTTQAGRSTPPGPERCQRRAYLSDPHQIRGARPDEDVDAGLNR
jgi:hypothetical protein